MLIRRTRYVATTPGSCADGTEVLEYEKSRLFVVVSTAVVFGVGETSVKDGTGGSHWVIITGTETLDAPSEMETVAVPAAIGLTTTLCCPPEPDTATSAIVASSIVAINTARAFDTTSVVGAVPVLYKTDFGAAVIGMAGGAVVAVGAAGAESHPQAAAAVAQKSAINLKVTDIVYSRGYGCT